MDEVLTPARSDSPPRSAAAPAPRLRGLLPLLALFVAPWLLYAAILAVQPVDPLVAWRGDVAWPAEHYLTVSQGGLWMPAFGHLMFGGIGGVLAAAAIGGLVRLGCWLLGARDRSGPVFGPVLILALIGSFTFFKAVPRTVTVIDPAARRLAVHEFGLFVRVPIATHELAGVQIVALELDSTWNRRNGTRYLRLYALVRAGGWVQLGERPCEVSDEQACLAGADPELLQLARWLGHDDRPVDTTRPGQHRVNSAL